MHLKIAIEHVKKNQANHLRDQFIIFKLTGLGYKTRRKTRTKFNIFLKRLRVTFLSMLISGPVLVRDYKESLSHSSG
jgi:hypothetical protein